MIDLTSHCWCVAPWLTFVACAPAFGQDTAPLQTISPRARAAFFYHDALNRDNTRSVEGWLYLSYHAGPVRLFSNHSLDYCLVRLTTGAEF